MSAERVFQMHGDGERCDTLECGQPVVATASWFRRQRGGAKERVIGFYCEECAEKLERNGDDVRPLEKS